MAEGDDNKMLENRSTDSVFNDPIHGHMEIHPLCVSIVDTPEFQRLRYIKQVGMAVYVYPGGNHTRFEHCIGVANLAGVFVKSLRAKQPELGITDQDILCTQIAGLCHDLGHGPFSHLWQTFMAKKTPKGFHKWTHEQMSVNLLDHLIKKHSLEKSFKTYLGPEYKTYIKFIKEQINGNSESRYKNVVSNEVSNIDVDKWDYLSRDCHHMGFKNYFDHDRLIAFARVCQCEDGRRHICFSNKVLSSINKQQPKIHQITLAK